MESTGSSTVSRSQLSALLPNGPPDPLYFGGFTAPCLSWPCKLTHQILSVSVLAIPGGRDMLSLGQENYKYFL